MLQKIEIKKEDNILSKSQKAFNKLLQDVEYLKKTIVERREEAKESEKFKLKYILPVQDELFQILLDELRALDYAIENFKLTKKEKAEVEGYIDSILEHLLDFPGAYDLQEVKDLDAKYQGLTPEEYDQQEKETLNDVGREYFKDMFDFDPGEDFDFSTIDPNNPNEAYEKFKGTFQEHFEKGGKSERKKTKKQLEKEKKQAEAENILKKSLRQLYTALVKRLHPDAEQDETLKQEKTEAMKQVTQAYESNDLKVLLELHVQHNLMEENQLSAVKDDELKIYVEVLTKQKGELQDELISFNMSNNLFGETLLNEKKAKKIAKEIKETITNEKQVLRVFQQQDSLKRYIKESNYW